MNTSDGSLLTMRVVAYTEALLRRPQEGLLQLAIRCCNS